MRRRIVWMAAALSALLVLPASPAAAAEFTLRSPDGDVTGPTDLEVELRRDFGAEPFHRVLVDLEVDGERRGSRVELECQSGCRNRTVVFGLPDGAQLDPATGAPFGVDGPMTNGTYGLRVEVRKDNPIVQDQVFRDEIHLAVPPTAPTDVTAELVDEEVELTWTTSPEPDVEAYRIQRRDGGQWETVGTASEGEHVDDPGEGEHTYRVVAERPDGREGRVQAASAEVTVEVAFPDEDDEDDEDDGNDGSEDGDDEDDEDRRGGDDDTGDDDTGDDDRDGRADTDSSSPDSGDDASEDSSRRARDPAAAPRTGSGSSSIPSLRDRGEEGYSSELDYGDVGDGGDADAADDVVVATPGGWRGTVDRIFDPEQIAVPIAAGLVMTATGAHLWRWLRVPLP